MAQNEKIAARMKLRARLTLTLSLPTQRLGESSESLRSERKKDSLAIAAMRNVARCSPRNTLRRVASVSLLGSRRRTMLREPDLHALPVLFQLCLIVPCEKGRFDRAEHCTHGASRSRVLVRVRLAGSRSSWQVRVASPVPSCPVAQSGAHVRERRSIVGHPNPSSRVER